MARFAWTSPEHSATRRSTRSQAAGARALRLSLATLALAPLAAVTACSSGRSAPTWSDLPVPSASPASVFMSGRGNGTFPVPGAGDLRIGVSCLGEGELKLFSGSTLMGSVQCFTRGGASYELDLSRSATSLQVRTPSQVIWEVSAGHAQ